MELDIGPSTRSIKIQCLCKDSEITRECSGILMKKDCLQQATVNTFILDSLNTGIPCRISRQMHLIQNNPAIITSA